MTATQLVAYALLVALPAAMFAGWTLRRLYAEHNLDVQRRVDAYTVPAGQVLATTKHNARSCVRLFPDRLPGVAKPARASAAVTHSDDGATSSVRTGFGASVSQANSTRTLPPHGRPGAE